MSIVLFSIQSGALGLTSTLPNVESPTDHHRHHFGSTALILEAADVNYQDSDLSHYSGISHFLELIHLKKNGESSTPHQLGLDLQRAIRFNIVHHRKLSFLNELRSARLR
jgi:hypothetical protein